MRVILRSHGPEHRLIARKQAAIPSPCSPLSFGGDDRSFTKKISGYRLDIITHGEDVGVSGEWRKWSDCLWLETCRTPRHCCAQHLQFAFNQPSITYLDNGLMRAK